jgi:phosphatidylglycerol:prolipoprotein diacylglycerol transferase
MIPYFEWKTIGIGPLTLQVWGMWVALGMALSLFFIRKRARQYHLKGDLLFDQAIWMIVLGLVFSRLFEVVFYDPAFYFSQPFEIVKIWHGGLSSFGGLLGAVIGFFVFWFRKNMSKMDILSSVDIFSFSALFGWIVGRIGCLMIHDHWGAHSNCPWAIVTSEGPRLEMAMLEILGLLPLALLFWLSRNKQKSDGWYTSILFMYYGVLRFILDFYRATDISGADARYLGLTPGHYSGILVFVCGLWLWTKTRK